MVNINQQLKNKKYRGLKKVVSNSLSNISNYIPLAPLKGGITEWYQVEC